MLSLRVVELSKFGSKVLSTTMIRKACLMVATPLFQLENRKYGCIFRYCSQVHLEQKKKQKLDHLTRTANQFRQKQMFKATVHKVEDVSETVRTLTIKIAEPGIHFKAGQWVDFFIPSIKEISGYSMTSPPYLAEEEGILDLAVRYSTFPPTYWIHKQCKLGEEITVRVGGEFHYDPQPGTKEATADILLIGGGVGINPMASIAQQYTHIVNSRWKFDEGVKPGRLKILYSAREFKELVFRDLFLKEKSKCSSISCRFFVTRDLTTKFPEDTLRGHITKRHLEDSIKDLRPENVICFICGPPSMIDSMEQDLVSLGVSQNSIRYEKWL